MYPVHVPSQPKLDGFFVPEIKIVIGWMNNGVAR